MTVRPPCASARTCKPSGRSAYRIVIISAPVRMPLPAAPFPPLNTEGDDIITDDHIKGAETGRETFPGSPGRRGGPGSDPRPGCKRGYAQGCRGNRTAGGEGDHADRPGWYPRGPAHGPAGGRRGERHA